MRLALVGILALPLAAAAAGQPPITPPQAPPDPAAASASTSTPGTDSIRAQERPAPAAPLPPPGEMARCKALIDAGLVAAARTRLEPIVADHPGWARATALLALTYYKEGRFEVAAPLFAKALADDPEEIAARPYYGWSLYSLGRLDEAEAMFRSLVERKPDYTPAHYALGVIHLDRDETDAARKSFETTVRLAAAQADREMEGRAHARLGELFTRLDDLPAARRELERAVDLFPADDDALFKLSRILQRLGDDEGAAAARQRYEAARARGPAGGGPRPADPTFHAHPSAPAAGGRSNPAPGEGPRR